MRVVMQPTHKHDLGIHTEMVGDGIRPFEAGAVTNRRKNFHARQMVATFALGSKKLYKFLHCKPDGRDASEWTSTNDPYIAARTTTRCINATLEIDFLGQCGSESPGPVPYPAPAASPTSCAQPIASKGGKAFIVPLSTAKDGTHLAHVTLTPGKPTCRTSKNDINHVVTEQWRRLVARQVRQAAAPRR